MLTACRLRVCEKGPCVTMVTSTTAISGTRSGHAGAHRQRKRRPGTIRVFGTHRHTPAAPDLTVNRVDRLSEHVGRQGRTATPKSPPRGFLAQIARVLAISRLLREVLRHRGVSSSAVRVAVASRGCAEAALLTGRLFRAAAMRS